MHLICSLQQLCLAQVLPSLGHQYFFRIFSAGFQRPHALGPTRDKVGSNANTGFAQCFNNLQKKRINAKPPDLTLSSSFILGLKMGVSPDRSSLKATVLNIPSCDY